jgi:hypothetical protein
MNSDIAVGSEALIGGTIVGLRVTRSIKITEFVLLIPARIGGIDKVGIASMNEDK